MPASFRILAVVLCASLLASCGGKHIQRKDGTTTAKPWSVTGLAKGDIDDVIELHQKEAIASLKTLAVKLYQRNPLELGKGGHADIDAALQKIFMPLNHWHLSPQRKLDWAANINNAFREEYASDRVQTLVTGMLTMLMSAYGHKTEVYLLDSLDPQKLYNAARNVEIIAHRLSKTRKASGELLLLTDGIDHQGLQNLSFEREYGKLIATQDMIARIVEDKTNRGIRFGVVNAASFVLLPI